MPLKEEIRKKEQELRKEAQLHPDNAIAHLKLGAFLYHELKQYEEAEKELKTASELETEQNATTHFFLASLYQELNKPDEAEKRFRKAIELKSYEAGFHLIFGLFLHAQKRLDEAEKELREAIRLKPKEKEEEVLARAALAYFLGTTKRFDEAEKELRAAIFLDPNFSINRALLAEILTTYADSNEEKDLYKDALEELNAGITSMSKVAGVPPALQAIVYNLRGYIQAKLNEPSKAKKDFERSVELDPENFKAKRNLRRIKNALEKQKLPMWVEKILRVQYLILTALSIGTIFLFLFHFVFEANFRLEDSYFAQYGIVFAFLFIFATISAFLPQITKLKVGTLELEKDVLPTTVFSSSLTKLER